MPELSASLRYVGSTEDWHEQAGIDWGAVENELRTIEAAALAAAREKAVVESENLVEAERSSSRQKRIEEERVGSDENIEISDPPPEMVLKLRGLSRELLMYMWKRGPVTRDELRPLWKKQPSDKAVENAINYLNEKLSQLHLKTTTVERNGGMYYLKHPQK